MLRPRLRTSLHPRPLRHRIRRKWHFSASGSHADGAFSCGFGSSSKGQPNGNSYGSLSQFQIVLWTLVVGASAVYVMVLSGNLIEVTNGTLVLLGIAGGAALLGRIPSNQPLPDRPAGGGQSPRWSDLVEVDGEIDATRIQMV